MGKRELNPADAQRKADRAREVSRNKKARQLRREAVAQLDDPAALREELRGVQIEEEATGGNATLRLRKKALQEAYEAALRKKAVERAEARRNAAGRDDVIPAAERRPEESVYWHPTANPSGLPPPGKPQRWKEGGAPGAGARLPPPPPEPPSAAPRPPPPEPLPAATPASPPGTFSALPVLLGPPEPPEPPAEVLGPPPGPPPMPPLPPPREPPPQSARRVRPAATPIAGEFSGRREAEGAGAGAARPPWGGLPLPPPPSSRPLTPAMPKYPLAPPPIPVWQPPPPLPGTISRAPVRFAPAAPWPEPAPAAAPPGRAPPPRSHASGAVISGRSTVVQLPRANEDERVTRMVPATLAAHRRPARPGGRGGGRGAGGRARAGPPAPAAADAFGLLPAGSRPGRGSAPPTSAEDQYRDFMLSLEGDEE